MALLSKKEFAEKCGMNTRALSVYINARKKVILSGEDQIDDTNEQNAAFLRKWSDKAGKSKPSVGKVKSTGRPSKAERDAKAKKEKESADLYSIEKGKKSTDAMKAQVELELQTIKRDKLRGALIPTEMVRLLFTTHFKSVTVEFNQAVDNLLIEISRKTKMNREQLADLRTQLTEIVNGAVDRSVDASKKSIQNLINSESAA